MSDTKWAEKIDECEAAAGNLVCTRCGLPLAPGEAERDCMTGVAWRRHNAERCVQLLRETADGMRVVIADAERREAQKDGMVSNLKRVVCIAESEARSAREAAAKMEEGLRFVGIARSAEQRENERLAKELAEERAARKTASDVPADESAIRRAFAERVVDVLRNRRMACVENALCALRESEGGSRVCMVTDAFAWGHAADELDDAAVLVPRMAEKEDGGAK